jgi:hypothetical protein
LAKIQKPYTKIVDFVTGKEIPNIGAEQNRQKVAQYLVYKKGYRKEELERDVDLEFTIQGELYQSQVDLTVTVEEGPIRVMVFKCCAASLSSREREILSAARLLDGYQIPFAVVSDGETAIVMDTLSGNKLGEGLDAIPGRDYMIGFWKSFTPQALDEKRREREKLIFRTYDMENVNVQRKLNSKEI